MPAQVALSESGTEYEIMCVKHVYANHILLQFHMNNTLEDQQLENVTVSLDLSAVGGLAPESELACEKLSYGSPSMGFCCLKREAGVPTGAIPCTLKFLVKDVDPSTGEPEDPDSAGYDDEYNLEELEIASADYVKKVPVADFREAWDSMGPDCEVVETFSLVRPPPPPPPLGISPPPPPEKTHPRPPPPPLPPLLVLRSRTIRSRARWTPSSTFWACRCTPRTRATRATARGRRCCSPASSWAACRCSRLSTCVPRAPRTWG